MSLPRRYAYHGATLDWYDAYNEARLYLPANTQTIQLTLHTGLEEISMCIKSPSAHISSTSSASTQLEMFTAGSLQLDPISGLPLSYESKRKEAGTMTSFTHAPEYTSPTLDSATDPVIDLTEDNGNPDVYRPRVSPISPVPQDTSSEGSNSASSVSLPELESLATTSPTENRLKDFYSSLPESKNPASEETTHKKVLKTHTFAPLPVSTRQRIKRGDPRRLTMPRSATRRLAGPSDNMISLHDDVSSKDKGNELPVAVTAPPEAPETSMDRPILCDTPPPAEKDLRTIQEDSDEPEPMVE